MKILALDTSTRFLCLGFYDSGKVYEYTLETSTRLSGVLTATIARCLQALGWGARDIDCFACGRGPGSFTGVRIGMSVIKGLSWALKKPVVGIPTLDVIARNAGNTGGEVITIVDAKRSLVYCGIYKGMRRIGPYMLLSKEDLLKKLKPGALVLGDGLGVFGADIAASGKGCLLLEKDYWFPRPFHLIDAAVERVRRKEQSDAFRISPVYLYPKECQIRDVKKKK